MVGFRRLAFRDCEIVNFLMFNDRGRAGSTSIAISGGGVGADFGGK